MTAAAGRACDRASLARDEALLAELAERVARGRRARSGEADWDEDQRLVEAEALLTDEEQWEQLDGELSAEADAWLAGLSGDPSAADDPVIADPGAARASTAAQAWPEGLWSRDGGDGAGFAAGGVADTLAPGVVLAGLADRAWTDGLAKASDDELIGVMRAWRRLTSWAQAGELAAVTELDRRRHAQVAAGADPHLADHITDELAMSLTLTARTAGKLLDFALALDRLPLTRAALAAGEIDSGKAYVIADEVAGLDAAHAAAVEAAVIDRAPRLTSGQLRAATHRAVLAADPGAARRRREQAGKDARVEVWTETAGTAALAGRDLPPAEVLAADRRISALARELKASGAQGTMDQLRAKVYTALLTGQSVESLLASLTSPESPAGTTPPDGPPARDAAAGMPAATPGAGGSGMTGSGITGSAITSSGITGSVNLTMPLSTWLGASEAPGNVPGFGPIAASDARELAEQLAARAGTRWCITLTDGTGRAVAHGCARARPVTRESGPAPPAPGEVKHGPVELTVTIRPLAVGECSHAWESAGYRPSPGLRHMVEIRNQRCTAPGCRRPAAQCDLDHTIPYDQGGRTCECDLAPKCRRHHKAKQVQGWRVRQPEPGVLVWRPPHGRTYRVEPEPYE